MTDKTIIECTIKESEPDKEAGQVKIKVDTGKGLKTYYSLYPKVAEFAVKNVGKKVKLTVNEEEETFSFLEPIANVHPSEKPATQGTSDTLNIRGKDVLSFVGLLKLAQAKDVTSIRTEQLSLERNEKGEYTFAQYKAIVEFGALVFVAYGDATPGNVGKEMEKALPRMAETRAVSRAIRFATAGELAESEIDGTEEDVA